MAYKHGIYTTEKDTKMPDPAITEAGVQVIFGTAPVNLADDPSAAVNTPLLIQTMEDAQKKLGYSEYCDWNQYTLCQSIYCCFKMIPVAPVVFVNVLDPSKHKATAASTEMTVAKKQCTITDESGNVFGVIKSSVTVKASSSGSALVEGEDYITSFDAYGNCVITLLDDGDAASATSVYVSYDKLDPSAVTENDIIGGNNNGVETGMELIRKVFPMFGITAGLILAPGWSHKPVVSAVMETKCALINGCFKSECIVDVDSTSSGATTYTAVDAKKKAAGLISPHTLAYWPMIEKNGHRMHMSALMGALITNKDINNDDVPYKSPSNTKISLDAVVLADGTKVVLDQEQGNALNAVGVSTIINFGGFRSWGNNTAAYPDQTDPVKRWINVRRFFTWWANNFVKRYMDRIDGVPSKAYIDSIVDEENMRCNGYVSRGYCAGARIAFNGAKSDVVNGALAFTATLTPFPPAEDIEVDIEFSVDDLRSYYATMGGEE